MIIPWLRRLDGVYPTAQDRAEVDFFLATAEARRAALEEVRQVAGAVAADVVSAMRERYPEFGRLRAHGFEKGQRDLVLLTNMAGNAMFLGETETLDEIFTTWYRTILRSVHMSPQFLRDTFDLWRERLQARLTPGAYGFLRPHAEHLSRYLCEVPVPARDETGRRVAAVG